MFYASQCILPTRARVRVEDRSAQHHPNLSYIDIVNDTFLNDTGNRFGIRVHLVKSVVCSAKLSACSVMLFKV